MRHLATLMLVLVAAPTAVAGLALEVEIECAEIGFEAPVKYVVRFVNRGTEEIRFFEPRHAGLITFPDVRLVRKGDGRELRPGDSPFQSMVSRGLQGTIVRLGPGEEKEYRYARPHFLAVDRNSQKADWFEPRALPDGEYELSASYTRAGERLPFGTGGFSVERRRVPGIFTGTVRAAPVTFRVRPPTKPHVRLSVPDRGTTEVVIAFANPSAKFCVFSGTATLVLSSKMYGSATATLLRDGMLMPVPPGGRIELKTELRDLAWQRDGAAIGSGEGLGEIVPRGTCHLTFRMEGGSFVGTDGLWIMVPVVPSKGLEDVTVTATLSPPGSVRSGEPITLEVHIENQGERDVGLIHRLAWPQELVISVEDATGRRPSIVSTTGKARRSPGGLRPRGEGGCKLAQGLSWDRDRFEVTSALTRRDFVWIEPEAGILREIELTRHLAKGITPGRYLVRAGYRNTETGVRLGFAEGRRPGTGIVWSEPVTLIVK